MFGVIGIQNPKFDGAFRDKFWIKNELSMSAPGIEYNKIGLSLGNFLATVRISMGDFAIIGAAQYLDHPENMLFWSIFVMAVVIQCIIFMNFIVAEAGATYSKVSE
jgi:hypothetical protein